MAAGSSTYEFVGSHYEDYQNQYNYKEPLTSGTIDSLTVYSNGKQILESRDLKKIFLCGDACFLPEYLDKHLIQAKLGTYLDISPHSYRIREWVTRFKINIGFCNIINLSEPGQTFGNVQADEELFHKFILEQPDVVSLNIGLTDIKLDNVSWRHNDLPNMYYRHLSETLKKFHDFAKSKGSCGRFIEDICFTVNLLPHYESCDATNHNKRSIEETRQHYNAWHTNYYNLERHQYAELANRVNHCLRKNAKELFRLYKCVIIQPAPIWQFAGVHADPSTGLPEAAYHEMFIRNYLFIIHRFICSRHYCRIDTMASLDRKATAVNLVHGCIRYHTK